jgi:hypothetical protein
MRVRRTRSRDTHSFSVSQGSLPLSLSCVSGTPVRVQDMIAWVKLDRVCKQGYRLIVVLSRKGLVSLIFKCVNL